ncbi:MAG: rod-binding protein [Deltaproteobacteria bacterium]|nr:rod-binding protein [Deltaproteobacteria bacterium]
MDIQLLTGLYKKETEINNNEIKEVQKGERKEKGLEKACADFESILIYQLLQTLRKTVPEGGYLSNKSSWGDTYTMMFDQKVAEDLAKRGGGIGLRKILLDQLDKYNVTHND